MFNFVSGSQLFSAVVLYINLKETDRKSKQLNKRVQCGDGKRW